MPNGFGYGRGSGRGFGGGMGFGFRGSSPPWPYVGRGRGGLPRCGYFASAAAMAPTAPYPQSAFPYYGTPSAPTYAPFNAPVSKDEELTYLKDEAEAIKGELDRIEARMRELEK
jgi:hypothetical protein